MNARTAVLVRRSPTVLLLIATNLVPLIGVAFGGWHLGTVMVLYWLENGVVGVLTIPRILLASLGAADRDAATAAGPEERRVRRLTDLGSGLVRVPFFLVHYGLFWAVHGIFVFALFASPDGFGQPVTQGTTRVGTTGVDPGAVATGFLALALYHLVAFVYWDVLRGASRSEEPGKVLFAPYPRLVVLHTTIVLGAFLVVATGQPIAALVLLVILKTVLDVATQRPGRGLVTAPRGTT